MLTTACPRCKQPLEKCGEVTVEGQTFPVFQCEDCIVPIQFGSETFEGAYTFAIGPDGIPFDPGADDLTDLQ